MYEMTSIPTLAYYSHQVKKSSLYHGMLHTHLTKYCVASITNLNSYDGFTNPGEHV